ncbi:uncharacterized protein LOC124606426 [Schistocerca americana]|uniref:uncharacterized protein LOC124606426 n=1 Tax=Schistocerca americana TaxID=7009 RepID=UPI001F4FBF82|nr:uncharacterized protein LOC124606426 [Schistocerca americana]
MSPRALATRFLSQSLSLCVAYTQFQCANSMSDNGSCATDDIGSCVVDSERLIAEVEKRPALYNRKLKEYSDRNLKEKLWGECKCFISYKIKSLRLSFLIMWKKLKDCFARELASQKKSSSGEAARKRRKYLYFDAMLFLLPQMEDRPTTSNIEIMPSSTGNKEVGSPPSLYSQNNNDTVQSTKVRHPTKRGAKKVTSYEESLLNILKDRQKEEVNEDKNFILMLVPMLENAFDSKRMATNITEERFIIVDESNG